MGEARQVLIGCARRRDMKAYSEMTRRLRTVSFGAHDLWLYHSSLKGRGYRRSRHSVGARQDKHGDSMPGRGFFELARELGRDTSDITRCWITELQRSIANRSIALKTELGRVKLTLAGGAEAMGQPLRFHRPMQGGNVAADQPGGLAQAEHGCIAPLP
jgi:hypothetical protein